MQNPREYLKAHPEALRLYAVSDTAWLENRTLEACMTNAARGGASLLRLRDKQAATQELVETYAAVRQSMAAFGSRLGKVLFVIDDDVEAAVRSGADGVHVGQGDAACAEARRVLGEDKIVGVSVQTVEQARAAQRDGADYLGVGALVKTATKPDAADVSLETLRAICEAVDIPVVGIGGLNAGTLERLRDTGVAGAAVVSAIFAESNVRLAAEALRSQIDAIVEGRPADEAALAAYRSRLDEGKGVFHEFSEDIEDDELAAAVRPIRVAKEDGAQAGEAGVSAQERFGLNAGAPYKIPSVLSIAGSDSSGGAGIQADIKAIEALGLFAQTAITAITAQNTLGVTAVENVSEDVVRAQIDAVFSDIRPDAVKIGMVSSADIIRAIAEGLAAHGAENVVLDPVMVATSGARLIDEGAQNALVRCLFARARVVTPNIAEAEVLADIRIESKEDMVAAARMISFMTSGAVLVKGGHRFEDADDLLYEAGVAHWIEGERIETSNSHGTGCTLSSAIASGLALGMSVYDAVVYAKSLCGACFGCGF